MVRRRAWRRRRPRVQRLRPSRCGQPIGNDPEEGRGISRGSRPARGGRSPRCPGRGSAKLLPELAFVRGPSPMTCGETFLLKAGGLALLSHHLAASLTVDGVTDSREPNNDSGGTGVAVAEECQARLDLKHQAATNSELAIEAHEEGLCRTPRRRRPRARRGSPA